MARYGMVVDLDRCIGCHGCEVACKNENAVDLGVYWNKLIDCGPYGEYPNLQMYFLPVMCQQCENAPCARICPTGALQQDDGIVTMNAQICSGCQLCIMACPYGAISLESIGLPSATSETMAQKSMRSVAVRCDLCKDWMKREGKSVPACVEACPVHARSVVQIG